MGKTWGVVWAVVLALVAMGCEGSEEAASGGTSNVGADTLEDASASVSGQDVVGSPDVASPEYVAPDTDAPDECAAGGCFGDPCDSPADCFSDLCAAHMGDKVCTKNCEAECPAGWTCEQVAMGGGDPTFMCVSEVGHLCNPCMSADDCTSWTSSAVCVDYGEVGLFCGAGCEKNEDCPEGFICEDSGSDRGGTSPQCVSEAGACECSAMAVELGLATRCSVTNEHGTCEGLRSCGQGGLSACDASTPGEEVCNGVDDDCDGEVDEATCDDSNPCTGDACGGEGGCVFTDLVQVPCDDESACTEDDLCSGGACVGQAAVCTDDNPCTDDSCDPGIGCVYAPNFANCDDGEPCTVGDTCKEGGCAPGPEVTCDDGNLCTVDLCDGDTGCVYELLDDPCDDGNACTVGDSCVDGACKGLSPALCDDEEGCTHDTCAPLEGCVFTPHTGPCDDGDVCTVGDVCADGGCGAGPQGLVCDDSNPCTADSCDAADGCVFSPADGDCSDGSDCTVDDACVAGACVGTGALSCDDSNPCTEDSCLPEGGCEHGPIEGPCFDGDLCTVGDACVAGTCVGGEPQGCDDSNPCTTDSCDDGGLCVHAPADLDCDDSNPCTQEDQCVAGTCEGAVAVDCDDGNPCTHDACDLETGCTHLANAVPCDDADPCTVGDTCQDQACVPGSALPCDDSNPCTADSCGDAGVCVHDPTEGDCDDGNTCTQEDQCIQGQCVGITLVDCDDGNICTDDGCEPLAGCTHGANTLPCEDGDACTTGETCEAEVCLAGVALVCDDQNPCTDDGCDEDAGCFFDHNTEPCDDGDVCTTVDDCEGGVCVGAELQECGDEDPCTNDNCHPQLGCVYQHNTSVCDDEDLCTQADVCEQGECVGTLPLACDDGNLCTDDVCESDVGCVFPANDAACEDGDACTVGDQCGDEACQAGLALDCDDGEFCNGLELCDALAGCLSGAPLNLDDGFDCTVDACDEANDEVTHEAIDGDCSDGSFCNGAEICVPTQGCVAGTPPQIDDGVACTQDSCQEDGGGGSILHVTDDGACPDAGLCTSAVCHPTGGCQTEVTEGCCGNEIVEGGESCDDGNQQNQDGCLANCQIPDSCKAILDAGLADGDGAYNLDPDGPGGEAPFSAWCDMSGGGWTLAVAWQSGYPSQTFGEFHDGTPNPSSQHAIAFKNLDTPSEYRVRYSGNGEEFSGTVAGGWESSGRSTRIRLSDNRYLIFDGQYCGSDSGFCAVHPNHSDNFNCDGNGGQLTGGGQGLFSQCTSDEWCGCGNKGWKVNSGTCAPSVCPIGANVLVYLR